VASFQCCFGCNSASRLIVLFNTPACFPAVIYRLTHLHPLCCAAGRSVHADGSVGCDGFQSDCAGCASQAACGFCHGAYTDSRGVEQRWSACYNLDGPDGGLLLCEEEAGDFSSTQAMCPAVEECDKDACAVKSCPSGQMLTESEGICCPTCEAITSTFVWHNVGGQCKLYCCSCRHRRPPPPFLWGSL